LANVFQYLINITITHPEYSHISPSGPGIEGETPLWIVTDPPRTTSEASKGSETYNRETEKQDTTKLPITGKFVEAGEKPTIFPLAIGKPTKKDRPKLIGQRLPGM